MIDRIHGKDPGGNFKNKQAARMPSASLLLREMRTRR